MGPKVYFRSAATTDVWLTPRYIVDALGPFDLDPCAPAEAPWRCATRHYTEEDDGLAQEWRGRVFLNPPYGSVTGGWVRRLADHGNGIALIFARTETAWFRREVWQRADAVLFFAHRVHFHKPDGSRGPGSSAPSVLAAYGAANHEALFHPALRGTVLDLARGSVTL